MKPLRVKRNDPTASAVVRLPTFEACLNGFGPACWLPAAPKERAGGKLAFCVLVNAAVDGVVGSEATGRIPSPGARGG